MKSAAVLRAQIEDELSARIPSALSPALHQERLLAPTGIPAIDELLGGGLPVGAITEMIGTECSGRTTLATSFIAHHTRANRVCAWIDTSDMLDPESAAAGGVLLDHLLWVRCGRTSAANPVEDSGRTIKIEASSAYKKPLKENNAHPRSKESGLSGAIDALLQGQEPSYRRDKSVKTPGAANRSLNTSQSARTQYQRIEQIPFDRLPARRGNNLLHKDKYPCTPHQSESQKTAHTSKSTSLHPPQDSLVASRHHPHRGKRGELQSGGCLDQALRSTDLLLQGGGFSAIVLDMGNINAEIVSRVPLATWFKFRAAADRNHTTLLLLTQHFCSKSSAEVVLRLSAFPPSKSSLLASISYQLTIAKQSFEPQSKVVPLRKPPQKTTQAEWKSPMSWASEW